MGICEHPKCNNLVKTKEARFCSLRCANSRPRSAEFKKDKRRTCKECQYEYQYSALEQKFCNSSCAAKYNNRTYIKRNSRSLKTKECQNCKKKTNNPKYCSVDCQHELRQRQRYEEAEYHQDDLSVVFEAPVSLKKYILHCDGHECKICKLAEWQGKPIPLIMDHIDGHSENNAKSNLRLVCGNCDMQLPTYKSKNKGNGRAYRRKRYAEGKSY